MLVKCINGIKHYSLHMSVLYMDKLYVSLHVMCL